MKAHHFCHDIHIELFKSSSSQKYITKRNTVVFQVEHVLGAGSLQSKIQILAVAQIFGDGLRQKRVN